MDVMKADLDLNFKSTLEKQVKWEKKLGERIV